MTTPHLTIGSVLPNGATILNMSRMDRDGRRFVLAVWEKSGTEYVSWSMSPDGHCEHGYYSRDYAPALARYVERSGGLRA